MSSRDPWQSGFKPREPGPDAKFIAPATEQSRSWGGRWMLFVPGGRQAQEYRRIWKGVSRRRRRRVIHAIRSGELLHDPEDARAVVRVAGQQRALRAKQREPWRLLVRIGFIVWLAVQLVLDIRRSGGGIPTTSLSIAAGWLALEVWGLARWRGAPERIARAESRHRDYLVGLGEPLPADEPATAMQLPGPTARRFFRGQLVVAAGLVFASFMLLGAMLNVEAIKDRHAPSRLAVYAAFLLSGITISAAATFLAARSWGLQQRALGKVAVIVVGALAGISTLAWTIGFFHVMFFGG